MLRTYFIAMYKDLGVLGMAGPAEREMAQQSSFKRMTISPASATELWSENILGKGENKGFEGDENVEKD